MGCVCQHQHVLQLGATACLIVDMYFVPWRAQQCRYMQSNLIPNICCCTKPVQHQHSTPRAHVLRKNKAKKSTNDAQVVNEGSRH
jgi:hypothetical protein